MQECRLHWHVLAQGTSPRASCVRRNTKPDVGLKLIPIMFQSSVCGAIRVRYSCTVAPIKVSPYLRISSSAYSSPKGPYKKLHDTAS